MPRLLFVSLIVGPVALVGCQDIEHYGVPNLEGGVGNPGTGAGGNPDAGAMDGGSDGGTADAGGPDGGSYVPDCALTEGGTANALSVNGVPANGGHVFADYYSCLADYLYVVLTPDECALDVARGLFIEVAVADVGVTVVPGSPVQNLVRLAYFDGAGNEYCNDGGTASGSLIFDSIGTAAGAPVSTLLLDLTLPYCQGPAGSGSIDVAGSVDVLIGRDQADACGP